MLFAQPFAMWVAMSMREQTLRQSEAHGKRSEQAHRRYLSAIKALAQVRRLELPAVQTGTQE